MIKTYRIEKANMQAVSDLLRPTMASDPQFMATCRQSMQVRPDHIILFVEPIDHQLLHEAAKLGTLLTGVN